MTLALSALIEPTVADPNQRLVLGVETGQACSLVQIYPVNIIDGLKRINSQFMAIGRDAACELVLNDTSVSRHHARLERRSDGYWIFDLNSLNGTFVDDYPIKERLLRGGESIRCGSFIFKFLASGLESQYHATVYTAMTRDGLTKAFNKNYMLDAMAHEMARAKRCQRPMSLLMLDIDHFKIINDTHGHLAGDDCLREFCGRLQNIVRDDDLLCRYGGEEFAIVLSETTLEGAVKLAEFLRQAIQLEPIATSAGPISITASIGVAQLSFDSLDLNPLTLIKQADEKLYAAKHQGRNRVCS